jgi:hypothetical protein
MKMKKAVILHNQVSADSPKDELDVLVQANEVFKSLSELGYQPVTVPFSLDFAKTLRAIKKISPLFVFNLVESVEGNGQLIHLAPALLDHDPGQEAAAAGRDPHTALARGREFAGKRRAGSRDIPAQIGLGARFQLVRRRLHCPGRRRGRIVAAAGEEKPRRPRPVLRRELYRGA